MNKKEDFIELLRVNIGEDSEGWEYLMEQLDALWVYNFPGMGGAHCMNCKENKEMTDKRVEEIRERVESGVDPGPWRPVSASDRYGDYLDIYTRHSSKSDLVHKAEKRICRMDDTEIDDLEFDESVHALNRIARNGRFIAHAREDIPYLLEALDKANATIKALVKEADYYRIHSNTNGHGLVKKIGELSTALDKAEEALKEMAHLDWVCFDNRCSELAEEALSEIKKARE